MKYHSINILAFNNFYHTDYQVIDFFWRIYWID